MKLTHEEYAEWDSCSKRRRFPDLHKGCSSQLDGFCCWTSTASSPLFVSRELLQELHGLSWHLQVLTSAALKTCWNRRCFRNPQCWQHLFTNAASIHHTVDVISTPKAGREWPYILIVAYLLVSVYKYQCFLLNMQQFECVSGAADCS